MIGEIARMAADARRRAMMAISRAVLAGVDDTQSAQALQLELLADETAEDVERFGAYGFTSVPFAGAEAVMVSVGGLRSHGIVIAVEDRRYRLTGLQSGEVALYDDQGQVVVLRRSGIEITSSSKVTVTAPEVDVISNNVNLGGVGGKKVALDGDPVVGGQVQASSTKTLAL